eukprot:m.116664 g.116664  ORF g.116664 m.116664 type:complete len:145 (+) comp14238_c0_seq7:56-490(+)
MVATMVCHDALRSKFTMTFVGTEKKSIRTRETILEFTETRNQLTDDVLELEGFLTQRKEELGGEVDITSINQFMGAKAAATPTMESVTEMLKSVQSLSNKLTSPALQQLILISNSSKFVERLTRSLVEKKNRAKQFLSKLEGLE